MSYQYRHVAVERVIDGDSVVLAIDVGNKLTWRDNFRLMGIDTPERGQDGYIEAGNYLKRLLLMPLARVETFSPDKYGRWLVRLWIPVSGGELCLNDVMVAEGFAVPYSGGKKA